MPNNDLLYNAAIAGFVGGSVVGRNPTTTTEASYVNLVDAAEAFATQVDSEIAEDATISAAGGAAVLATTDDIVQAQAGKVAVMTYICYGMTSGRVFSSETAADYADIANVIAAMYAAAIAALSTP